MSDEQTWSNEAVERLSEWESFLSDAVYDELVGIAEVEVADVDAAVRKVFAKNLEAK